ncbi:hypothetical protein [Roseateles asaccharophilus]|uniref:L,D-transpeptidase n=1 Tax=Roseateles asaccharophilus TaxID=582607 RepID=A0ABU2A868_9BURK|nr:hypothetical protein [Roseateles asaccharophilus]MDR7333377.1 hypothetical protein [Roseateles asaccharophilus]
MRFGPPADVDAATSRRRDVISGLVQGGLIAAAALVVLYIAFGARLKRSPAPLPPARPAMTAQAPDIPSLPPVVARQVDFGTVPAPADVMRVATWAVRKADNGDRSFVIVDKRRARIYVFAPDGRLVGDSPVLLGFASGDHTVAGIGDRPIDQVKPHERTTPAGRFQSAPGRNALNEDVVWVDYDAAVSMHRVRATNPKERRLERLASKTAADNRISWGCINVPVAFFDETVWPRIGKGRGVVYVLPERSALTAYFPDAAPSQPPRQYAQAALGRGNNARP